MFLDIVIVFIPYVFDALSCSILGRIKNKEKAMPKKARSISKKRIRSTKTKANGFVRQEEELFRTITELRDEIGKLEKSKDPFSGYAIRIKCNDLTDLEDRLDNIECKGSGFEARLKSYGETNRSLRKGA